MKQCNGALIIVYVCPCICIVYIFNVCTHMSSSVQSLHEYPSVVCFFFKDHEYPNGVPVHILV